MKLATRISVALAAAGVVSAALVFLMALTEPPQAAADALVASPASKPAPKVSTSRRLSRSGQTVVADSVG